MRHRLLSAVIHSHGWKGIFFLLGMWLFGFLVACSPVSVALEATPIYRPPTPMPNVGLTPLTLTATPALTLREEVLFSPEPTCYDDLRFMADLTIPDGTSVPANSVVDKRWLVVNSGTCNWDERYRLRLIAGPSLGAPQEQALYPARGGTEAVIRIIFTAPSDPGTYRSAWQTYNSAGVPFGDMIFVEFVVP